MVTARESVIYLTEPPPIISTSTPEVSNANDENWPPLYYLAVGKR